MDGDADGSIAMTEAAEKFSEDHNKLYTELVMPERTKSVCEVCGVFINSTDNEQRRLVRSCYRQNNAILALPISLRHAAATMHSSCVAMLAMVLGHVAVLGHIHLALSLPLVMKGITAAC